MSVGASEARARHGKVSRGCRARALRLTDAACAACVLCWLLRARLSGPNAYSLISPTHKRTEGRAPVWGSEFTSKRRRTTGGNQQKPL